MTALTPQGFFKGQPAYVAGPGPKLYFGFPIAIALFVAAQVAAGLLYTVLGFDPRDVFPPASPSGSGSSPGNAITTGQLRIVLMSQILLIPLTLLVAAYARGGLVGVLRLGPPDGGPRTYLLAVLGFVPLLAVTNAIAYTVKPDAYLNDFRLFLETVRGPAPVIAAVAIGLGAPFSEELLFRGYLLSSATATRIPFWPSALIVNVAWTALHIQYSIIGLIEVFVIGLYLSWLMQRTGSLRVPLFCHALYNSTLFVIMRFAPIS